MRLRLIGLFAVAALIAAAAVASATALGGSSAAQAKNKVKVKIALPGPNQVKVSLVKVKVTAPKGKRVGSIKVKATNAADLGSSQVNAQVVASVTPKKSKKRTATFRVLVFIHQFQPVKRPGSAATSDAFLQIVAKKRTREKIKQFVADNDCDALSDLGYYDDEINDGSGEYNLVPTNDTAAEEQIDRAVYDKPCKGAETPDTGGS